jgi:putative Mg2+ transporter-C (MgtC) family protein
VQGIVAGVGFIGGGVILFREDKNTALGLTTAATIWVVSVVGVAVGGGLWREALLVSGLTLLLLTVGQWFETYMHRKGISDKKNAPDA